MKTKYRIIQDWAYTPKYYVQKKIFWFPFWITCYLSASFDSEQEAYMAAKRLIDPVVKEY